MGVVRGAVLLGLLWWAWGAYTWLGNQAHADAGLLRLGMAVAMIAVFVAALAVPKRGTTSPEGCAHHSSSSPRTSSSVSCTRSCTSSPRPRTAACATSSP